MLYCSRETSNLHDLFAVKVLRTDYIVGHLPKKISSLCTFGSCSFPESKRTDSEESMTAIRHFALVLTVNCTYVLITRCACAHNVNSRCYVAYMYLRFVITDLPTHNCTCLIGVLAEAPSSLPPQSCI